MIAPTCSIDLLRSLFLFEKLSDDRLDWLCREGRIEVFEPGYVYREGEPPREFYILLEGTAVLSRRVGSDDVDTTRTSQRGVYAGAWQAYLGDRAPQAYNNSLRVTTEAAFFVLDSEVLTEMMSEWFPMALHLLEGLFFGMRASYETAGQRERLVALGSLAAGLTHELNNPASAAVRATGALRDRVAGMRKKLTFIASGRYDPEHLAALVELQEVAAEQVAVAERLGALEASDREDEIADWFADHGISQGYELAPNLVQAGLDSIWLDKVLATVGEASLPSAVKWLDYTIETELLMNEIEDSTERISALVKSAKQYSQLDRAPFQNANVHELLDSTLVMLSGKLGAGITVVKDYDRSVPTVPAYAAELNQVWTNLIDNAVAAMAGSGTLTIRTSQVEDSVQVAIGDTGGGISPEIIERIFEPFFTTKAVGEGTGLGLDISYRIVVNKHHGDLRVDSKPGQTWFTVTLPIHPPDEHAEQRALATDPIG
ncbi:histidine kinase/DNA gyrase B/HSP90-like ATPase [Jatrophihabitans sp. GAS493]|uniref:ATP-binding protein n=1 Tax=Jatrophihabitans sp. GAS493 TaxID=1907575 RepID=UPI000BBF7251|nr:ATP-binding protein [Jatrophihabitans sp. GAS493]SOD71749.1 histidine kinase/DNA gyrase B/HSP90-like ATPase [Jatrophihabitans sp. GAS493]